MIALAATLAVRVAAWLVASNWLWGVDTFHHWPVGGAAALVALALLGFAPPVSRAIERVLARFGSAWERSGWLGDLGASAAVAVLLLILRDPVRFTGDFDLRVGLLGLAVPPPGLLEHVYPLDMVVNFQLPRALASAGMSAASALQLTGALMGGLFALVGFRFLRGAGARGAAYAAGALVLLSGSTLVHFAGYDKFGPLLLGLALAAKGAVAMARTGRGAWTLTAGISMAVLSHRSGYLLLPSVAWIMFRGLRAAAAPGRRRILVAAGAMAVVLLALLPRTVDMVTHFDRNVHLPGGGVSKARVAGGAPEALLRISNGLNALSLLAPLWLAGLAAAVTMGVSRSSPRPQARVPRGRFSLAPATALALGAFAALLLGVEPGGGWARDWDVATGTGTLAALATAYALVTAWRSPDAVASSAPAVTLALAVSVALWGVHSSESISLRRVDMLASARPLLSDAIRTGIYDFWGVRALNRGQSEEAARLFERAIAVGGPNPRLVHQSGLAYLAAGRLEPARSAFRRAAALSRVGDPWLGLARIALIEGDTLAALGSLDSALVRNPSDPEARRLAGMLRSRSVIRD